MPPAKENSGARKPRHWLERDEEARPSPSEHTHADQRVVLVLMVSVVNVETVEVGTGQLTVPSHRAEVEELGELARGGPENPSQQRRGRADVVLVHLELCPCLRQ